MRTIRLAVSALVVCTALAACGGGDGAGTPDPTGASAPVTGPSSASPSASPDPGAASTAPPPLPPTGPKRPGGGPTLPPPAGDTTLTGTVTGGVEPNCLLLDGYLLVGGPRDVLAVGARVTVTGRAQPDMVTTCQQGTPFVVEAARRA